MGFKIISFIALLSTFVTSRNVSLPDQLNKMASFLKPQIRALAQKNLPNTIGNCLEDNPPQPCSHSADLYRMKTPLFLMQARWLSGMNDLHVREMNVTALPNAELNISVLIEMTDVPMSLRFDWCWFGQCRTMLDNHSACCGQGKRVWASIITSCSPTLPFLANARLDQFKLDQIVISQKFFNRDIQLADVTTQAENQVRKSLESFMTNSDTLDEANKLINRFFGRFDLKCHSLKQ